MDRITETAIFGGTPYWAQEIELKPGISSGYQAAPLRQHRCQYGRLVH